MSCSDQACSLSSLSAGRAGTALPAAQQISPIRRSVYESIIMYYNDPMMYKVESPNRAFSLYVVGVTCFCADRRYLIAVCPPDRNGLGAPMRLSQLNWVSFQARVSPTQYPVSSIYVEGNNNPFTNTEIRQIPDENGIATYQVQGYPMKVQLVGGQSAYRDNGTVGEALQTYSTVLYFA